MDELSNLRHECKEGGKCYKDSLPKFGVFNGIFPRPKIKPTDLDFVVEINGRFLVVEFKGAREAEDLDRYLGGGQGRMLRTLSERDGFTVVLARGDMRDMSISSVATLGRETAKWSQCDLEELRERMREWGRRVDRLERIYT